MKPYVLLISLVAACGGLLFGFDTAVISGVLPFIQPYFSLSEAGLGWAVSSVIAGCIIGTQLAGKPGEILGRKKTLIITSILFIISALGSALAYSFTAFIFYRIIGGIAVGAASVLSPVYIAEIAPPKQRGRLVSINQLTLVIGILLAFFSNYFLIDFQENWRWMLGIGAVPAFVFFAAMLFVPESPRWLYMKGHHAQAQKILSKILNSDELSGEINTIRSSAQTDNNVEFKAILQPKYKRLIIVGIVLAMLQQFTGINVIMYYAPIIFQSTGVEAENALLQTIAIGGINLLFTIVAMGIIDRVGRKPLIVWGSFVMAAFLLLLSVTFFMNAMEGGLIILAILGFIAAFAVSSGPVTWVLISEIFPNQIRGNAVSLATLFLWIAAFIVSYTFPVMLESWKGGYTFLFYAVINFAGFLFTKYFVAETKGKSLEELEILLTE